MATGTKNTVRTDLQVTPWRSAIIASLVAGVVMGGLMQYVTNVIPLIGALYGSLGLWTGWTAHLFHSVVFGLLYAGVVGYTSLARYADGISSGTVLGAAYGVVVWAVAAGVVMPIWLSSVLLEPPAVPNFDPTSLVAHVVFGVLLGAVYAVLRSR